MVALHSLWWPITQPEVEIAMLFNSQSGSMMLCINLVTFGWTEFTTSSLIMNIALRGRNEKSRQSTQSRVKGFCLSFVFS